MQLSLFICHCQMGDMVKTASLAIKNPPLVNIFNCRQIQNSFMIGFMYEFHGNKEHFIYRGGKDSRTLH